MLYEGQGIACYVVGQSGYDISAVNLASDEQTYLATHNVVKPFLGASLGMSYCRKFRIMSSFRFYDLVVLIVR